jgi:MFS family permease
VGVGAFEKWRGLGFGIHEALDQIGAVIGPLVVAAVLYLGGGYSGGFAVLLVPGILAMGVLIAARRLYPRPRELEEAEERPCSGNRVAGASSTV